MIQWFGQFWADQEGQDVAEYGVMLAVVLVIVMGTIRLIGQNAGNIFSQVGSSIHQEILQGPAKFASQKSLACRHLFRLPAPSDNPSIRGMVLLLPFGVLS
jgi:Flp pilus assembly pilin Flp